MKKFILEHLAIDVETNSPVVLLSSVDGDQVLPIWIGPPEAFAIAVVRNEQEFPRPLTHDLLAYVVKGFDATVEKIVISGLQEGTYYALIELLKDDGEILKIDARPSDSIALALRTEADIHIDDSVPTLDTEGEDNQEFQELQQRLKKIDGMDLRL